MNASSRTQSCMPTILVVALVAAISFSTSLVAFVCPPPATALFAMLLALNVAVALQFGQRPALATTVASAAIILVAQVGLSIQSVDPTFALLGTGGALIHPALTRSSTWAPALVAVLALLIVGGGSAWSVIALTSRPSFVGPNRADGASDPWPEWPLWPALQGLEQVERELARASQFRREVSLSLLAVDGPQRGSKGQPDQWMERLVDLVQRELSRFDIMVRYGPSELLIVLPELSATAARAGASLLPEMIGSQLGFPVRAAFVTYPQDGTTASDLISALLTALSMSPRSERAQAFDAKGSPGGGADAQRGRLRRGRFRVSS
jgi:GGDEF domain-containing protein